LVAVFWIFEELVRGRLAGCHYQALLARRNHVLAASNPLGLVGAAGDIDGDRHFDLRVQGQRYRVEANVLDRRIKRNLAARYGKPGGREDRHDVARRYRAVELAGFGRLADDDEALAVELGADLLSIALEFEIADLQLALHGFELGAIVFGGAQCLA